MEAAIHTPIAVMPLVHLVVHAILALLGLEKFVMIQMNVYTTMGTVIKMPIATILLVHLFVNANLVLMEPEKIVMI